MIIVLDTNCLLQIIPKFAKHRWLFDLIRAGKIDLGITHDILLEHEEQLSQFYSPIVANGILQTLDVLPNITYLRTSFQWRLIALDPDDDKFSDCAVATDADFLVTYDKHFNVLDNLPYPIIKVVNIEEFEEILKSRGIL